MVLGLGSGYLGGTVNTTTTTITNVVTQIQTSLTATTVTKPVTTTVTQPGAGTVSIVLVTEGYKGGRLGPDGKTHDTVTPSNFTVRVGQVVNLTIVNYSGDPHTFSSRGLNVNFQYPGASSTGVPSVKTFQFTATKAGVYRWSCLTPCDLDQNEWSMTSGTDGQIGQIGFMGGFVTVIG